MLKTDTARLCEILGVINNLNIIVENVVTDSRHITSGCLFVPLVGEKYNAHDYIISALNSGAAVSLCNIDEYEKRTELHVFSEKLILTNDVQSSYFKIMSWWRDQFPNVTVVGIGGSVGKTTTKELMRRICEEDGKTIYTKANLNTSLGMCLIVNELEQDTKYMICEMGTDHFGEIVEEAEICKPNIGVCLSVTATHAVYMGGNIEGVAKAESELVQYLSDKDFIALNMDDPFVADMKKLVTTSELKTIGFKKTDVYPEKYDITEDGMNIDLNILKNIFVPTYGEGNIYNVMVAVALSKKIGISDEKILSGISKYEPVGGRMSIYKTKRGITVHNDSYNANPQSMKQSIDVFSKLAGESYKIFVLGDMRELGNHANEAHDELVGLIRNSRPDVLVYIGDYNILMHDELQNDIKDIVIFPNIDTEDFDVIKNRAEVESVADIVKSKLKDNCRILFKASKGTGLWKVFQVFQEEYGKI